MPQVIDWQSVRDPDEVVRYAAQALAAGRVVAFPTETSYTLAASGLAPDAVDRLPGPLGVAVRGLPEARDWVPGLSRIGQRLARRFWPGPVALAFADVPAEGLAGRLPPRVRERLTAGGGLRLRMPAHEALLAALRHFAGPVVLAEVEAPPRAEGEPLPVSAEFVRREHEGRIDLLIDDGPGQFRQPATVVRVGGGDGWEVAAAGAVSADEVRRQAVCLVVFVCTGNTCRSPMADALFKKLLAERLGCGVAELPGRGYCVLSAGLAAAAGDTAAEHARAAVAALGGDLTGHASRPLTADLAAQADYLVAMTRGHALALTDHFRRLGSRPRLLSAAGEDIPDPIGSPAEVYEACARAIRGHLEALCRELVP